MERMDWGELADFVTFGQARCSPSIMVCCDRSLLPGLPVHRLPVRLTQAVHRLLALQSRQRVQVGPDQVDDSAYYLLICPQNVVGNTIMDHLHGMVGALPF